MFLPFLYSSGIDLYVACSVGTRHFRKAGNDTSLAAAHGMSSHHISSFPSGGVHRVFKHAACSSLPGAIFQLQECAEAPLLCMSENHHYGSDPQPRMTRVGGQCPSSPAIPAGSRTAVRHVPQSPAGPRLDGTPWPPRAQPCCVCRVSWDHLPTR